jgi:predicted dehydrogenase
LLALEAGKPVLCEKPFAINRGEAEAMVSCARDKGLFLMEGMWTRFFPIMAKVRSLLAEGAIGEPRMLTADFGFRCGWDPESRLLNPELGGGGLLDVGIYPVSFSYMVFGAPACVESMATLGKTGVDEQAAILFGYEQGQIALLHTAVQTQTVVEAVVMGTEGMLRIRNPFFKPHTLMVTSQGQSEEIKMPYEPQGFQFEAQEVAQCLRAGKLECDIMPLDESLAIMETLDSLRAHWGLRYPVE